MDMINTQEMFWVFFYPVYVDKIQIYESFKIRL